MTLTFLPVSQTYQVKPTVGGLQEVRLVLPSLYTEKWIIGLISLNSAIISSLPPRFPNQKHNKRTMLNSLEN